MTMKATRETDLVNACLQLLKLRGVFAWRQNTAGIRRRDRAGREFWAAPALRGVADILAVAPGSGKLVALEVKRPGGKPTAEQVAFLDSVNVAGGIGMVIRDVGALAALLDQLRQDERHGVAEGQDGQAATEATTTRP